MIGLFHRDILVWKSLVSQQDKEIVLWGDERGIGIVIGRNEN